MAKPKSKTEKKLDNNLSVALTDVCEQLMNDVEGFEWLTHQANYTDFPASLLITCVFDSDAHLQQAQENSLSHIHKLIQSKLLKIGVRFKALKQQILLDSEERCLRSDDGNWQNRLARQKGRSVLKNRPK